jgi:hypothetical protein
MELVWKSGGVSHWGLFVARALRRLVG